MILIVNFMSALNKLIIIESLIDTFTWPIIGDCGEYGNKEIARLVSHYKLLLETNGCCSKRYQKSGLS